MKSFENDKIMGHSWDFLSPRNEDVDECTQTDSSRTQDVDSASDDPRSSAGGNESPNAQAAPKKGCLKGNPPESGNERIFVLRNCNQCHDYTVAPCGRCRCPRKDTACEGSCKGKEETAADSCPLRQGAPDKAHRRREGGTCPLCQSRSEENEGIHGLCGGLCKECNSRIHDAMGKYFQQRAEAMPPYFQTPTQSLYQPYLGQVYGYPYSYPYSVSTFPLPPLPLPQVQQACFPKSQSTECDMRQPSGNNCECPRPQGSVQQHTPKRSSQLSGHVAPQQGPQHAPQQAHQHAPQQGLQQAGQWQAVNSSQAWSPQQPQHPQQQIQQIFNDPQGAPPLNIIVLQDCDNNALIDQLTTAITRSGGQGQATLQPPPPPRGMEGPPGYSNYSYNNPLSGYIDYEMVDFNRGSQHQQHQQYNRNMDYDDAYSMDMDGYMDGYQQSRSSCEMSSCPAKNPAPGSCACKSNNCTCKSCPSESKASGCHCECKCSACECNAKHDGKTAECDPSCGAECARKCCKPDLSALLTRALEIFIGLSEEPKKKRKHKPYSSYSKKHGASNADYITIRKSKMHKRVASGSTTLVLSRAHKEEFGLSRAPSEFNTGINTAIHTALPTPAQSTMPSPMLTHMHSPRESVHELGRNRSTNYLTHGSDAIPFFLPNCEKNRCKHDCLGRCSKPPHNCSKGCKAHCKGPCHKRGGGDASSKKNERNAVLKNARCFQCNTDKVVESGRTWQEVDTSDIKGGRPNKPSKSGSGCAGCAGGSGRKSGGAGGVRVKNGLLGLSPIAHYRPGMLQFPVNYLLTGAHTRRSLVRTAAGVTLHQSPYVDLTEGRKVQPRKKNRNRSKDRRAAAKKWQTVPSRAPGKYALSEIENRAG